MVFIRRLRRFPSLRGRTFNYPPRIQSVSLPPLVSHIHTSCHRYSSANKPVVGILGGGISGLSVAYYLTKLCGDKVHTVLFEESDRVGGWIKTVKGEGFFEMGPRTIRPFGVRGLNTLDLVEEIGLDNEVLYVERGHDVAKNRFIYVRGGLVKLPSDYSVLYRRVEPFSRALGFCLLRDVFARREVLSDDSIYNFVSRRFGNEIAEYLTDPMIRGICAGDSKKVSVKFIMKNLFELEQKHGSVVIGTLKERFSKKKGCSLSEEDKGVGFSKVAAASTMGNWAVWGLERGIESLPLRILEWVKQRGVQVKTGCSVQGLEFDGGRVGVRFSLQGKNDVLSCDRVVSCVGSRGLGRILRGSTGVSVRGDVLEEIERIEYADVQVTGFRFRGDVLREGGFGFLVPSCEKSVGGLLGVVFDTNCFPQGGDTVVTVMSRGVGGVREGVDVLRDYVRVTLGIRDEPVEVHSEVLVGCIPQYGVGHYERVGRVLQEVSGLVGVCGSWVDGVSVNDCVYRGRVMAGEVGRSVDFVEEGVRGSAAG